MRILLLALVIHAFIPNNVFAEDARLLSLYNRYSGVLKQYYLDDNGKPKGGALSTIYWRNNLSEINTAQVSNKEGRHFILMSSQSLNNDIYVHGMSMKNGKQERMWSKEDRFDDIRSYQVNGKYFFLLSENENGGRYAIHEIHKENPVPGKRIHNSTNWSEWTYHDFVYHQGKTYLVRYHFKTGELRINEMDGKGKIGKKVKNTTIDKGWTSFVFYTYKQNKYLMRLNRNSGRMVINKIDKNLSFGKKIKDNQIAKGWQLAEYSWLNSNDAIMYFYNRRDNRQLARRVNPDGTLGKVLFQGKQFDKGWTSIDILGGEKPKKSMAGGSNSFVSRETKRRPKANKSASVIVFYNTDDMIWQIAQRAQVQEEFAIKGYDKSVLLTNKKYTAKPKPSKTIKATEENFFKTLIDLADDGYFIDIFILTHGSRTAIILEEKNNNKYDGNLYPRELIERLTPIYGEGRFPIRMVFQLNCWGGSAFNHAWRDVGAKVVGGARYTNYLCLRFTPLQRSGIMVIAFLMQLPYPTNTTS